MSFEMLVEDAPEPRWYGLNIPVPSKSLCWNPTAQCDGIKRWSCWEVMGHEGGASWLRLVPFSKIPLRAPSALPPREDTARRCDLWTGKPWSCASSFQNSETFVVDKPPIQWCFSSLNGLRHEGGQSVTVFKLGYLCFCRVKNEFPPKMSISYSMEVQSFPKISVNSLEAYFLAVTSSSKYLLVRNCYFNYESSHRCYLSYQPLASHFLLHLCTHNQACEEKTHMHTYMCKESEGVE